jgi:hypothetical protein
MSVIQIIIISAAIILCTLIIGFLFPLFDSIKEKLNDRNINTNDCEIFYEAIRLRRAWKSISQRWLICDYMFKIIPFECTSIILYLETFAPDGKETALAVFGFSIISMIIIILPFAVRPYEQMKAYRKAYLVINSLIYLFIQHGIVLTKKVKKR